MGEKRGRVLKIVMLCFALAVIGGGIPLALRWTPLLRDPVFLASLHRTISSLGAGGWLILLGIQYAQIVVAFIPGGPIQILAGILYGPAGGLATCILGILAASATVFALTRRFGRRAAALFIGEKDFAAYRFLQDEVKLERLCFLLYLIPGAPKDVLTYLFALTPMPLSRFLLLSVAARIPAALTSALAGGSLAAGDWARALAYFLGLTALSLLGLFLHRKIMALHHRGREK